MGRRGPVRGVAATRHNVQQLANASRELTYAYKVVIVQPGLSKAKIAPRFP